MDPSLLASTSTLPSIFELLAQSSLRQLLQPAFTYSLTLCANHYPRYLIPLAQRHEEVWAALLLLVERWCLLKHDASFSEQFYGLKRRRARRIEMTRRDAFVESQGRGLESRLRSRLTKRQIWLSLIELVVLPYLGLKLHDLFLTRRAEVRLNAEEAPDAEDDTPQPQPTRRQRLRRLVDYLFLLIYPSLTTALAIAQLGWSVRYLFERTRFWTPTGLIGAWVVDRVDAADIRDPLPARPTLLSPITRRMPSLPIVLPSLLPTLLLSLKLYEFYHALPAFAPSVAGALPPSSHPPIPPPPKPSAPPDHPTRWGFCVVCGEPWKGPTVLAGSNEGGGWVGCWSCFWDLGEDEDTGAETAPEGEKTSTKLTWWRGRVDRDRMRRVLL